MANWAAAAFQDKSIRAGMALILRALALDTRADAGVFAVPEGGSQRFRVWLYGVDEDPFGTEGLLVYRSPHCATVLQDGNTLAVRDARGLPDAESCSLMRAEELAGFLGTPVHAPGHGAEAVVAVVTREPRVWLAAARLRIEEAGRDVESLMAGLGETRASLRH